MTGDKTQALEMKLHQLSDKLSVVTQRCVVLESKFTAMQAVVDKYMIGDNK